jgi:hypothetical protein
MREFETGATRDTDTNKPDYEGFISPLVTERFGRYMMAHKKQADGKLRASDNWQKGIPMAAYVKSLLRHVQDLLLHWDGYQDLVTDRDLESVCCAIRFNVDGFLHELIKNRRSKTVTSYPTSWPIEISPEAQQIVKRWAQHHQQQQIGCHDLCDK